MLQSSKILPLGLSENLSSLSTLWIMIPIYEDNPTFTHERKSYRKIGPTKVKSFSIKLVVLNQKWEIVFTGNC